MKTITHSLIIMIMLIVTPFCKAQTLEVETGTAQEKTYKLRPIRVGAKLGFPNLIVGNIEYVTPLLNKKLAVSVDYSSIILV